MITYRLADALPQIVLHDILNKNYKEQQKHIEIENQVDKGYGSCILAKPAIAKIVADNWLWFNEKRYKLIAFVVMPNHVHLLIHVFEGVSLSKIVQGWKSYTSKAIQHLLSDNGVVPRTIWQSDYWDRYIRNEQHFNQSIEYIHNNPVKAGLCERASDWLWSSAYNSENF